MSELLFGDNRYLIVPDGTRIPFPINPNGVGLKYVLRHCPLRLVQAIHMLSVVYTTRAKK